MLSTFMASAETAGQNGHGSTEQSPRGYRMLPIKIRRRPANNAGGNAVQPRMFAVKTWGRMRSETACGRSRFVRPQGGCS